MRWRGRGDGPATDAAPEATPQGQEAGRPDRPAVADPARTDPRLAGLTGRVSVRVPGGDRPGEVRVLVRGMHELLIAYSPEPLAVDDPVVVTGSRSARTVDVEYDFSRRA